MQKSISTQMIEYLEYLKEQGETALPVGAKWPPVPKKRKAKAAPASSDAQPLDTAAASPFMPEIASAAGLFDGSCAPAAASGEAIAPLAKPVPTTKAKPIPERAPAGTVDSLESLKAMIAGCTSCPLGATRKHTVPGQGPLRPEIMFVGEGPGADEDEQGLAFVGRAGQLLTKMIEAMGFRREEVFIGNIVKCRPPGNRVPTSEEMTWCIPYLKRQIAVIQPKYIVCLGATAVRGLTGDLSPISRIRGTWREFEGIPVMLTFHPAYLLRDPRKKKEAWADLRAVMARLGR